LLKEKINIGDQMIEVMAKILTSQDARSESAAEEIAIKNAAEPYTYWVS
jgi:hypothetical protein